MTHQAWPLPPIPDILDEVPAQTAAPNILRHKRIIESTLAELGYPAQVHQIKQGPRVTLFSLGPDADTQLSKIKNLDTDLAVALSGAPVQILPPSPEQPVMSVLVAHSARQAAEVKLRQVVDTPAFRQHSGLLKAGLGLDMFGAPVLVDLTELPHLLIGGATGAGKSACLHALIAGLLCTYPPNALQFLMIDPLTVELRVYNNLPHLFAPVVTRSNQALDTLGTVDKVIDRRYQIFSENQARNIEAYNQILARQDKDTIPYIVIVIDNVFDLLMTSANEVELMISRMARRARGAGVHLILSTPRPDTEALSGTIKANFPGRIAFRTMGPAESRLILDSAGAEELLGPGDMLYKAPNSNQPQRVQGIHISEAERQRLIDFWKG